MCAWGKWGKQRKISLHISTQNKPKNDYLQYFFLMSRKRMKIISNQNESRFISLQLRFQIQNVSGLISGKFDAKGRIHY